MPCGEILVGRTLKKRQTHRYNRIPLLRFRPGGFCRSWSPGAGRKCTRYLLKNGTTFENSSTKTGTHIANGLNSVHLQ